MTIRVVLVDDQKLIRMGLQAQLASTDDLCVVGEASNGEEAYHIVRDLRPNVVLMDIKMPILNGIAATRKIHTELPDVRIVLLTTFDDDEYVFQGLRAGAIGYMLKDADEEDIFKAIRLAASGDAMLHPSVATKIVAAVARGATAVVTQQIPLSDRESEILSLLARGWSNQEVADHLLMAEGTIRNKISRIFEKLGVENRTQAALKAKDLGIV